MGCVYFYKQNKMTPIKIGMTIKDHPADRISQLRTGSPYGGELIGYFQTSNPNKDEKEIHILLKDSRLEGEWFDIGLEELDDIYRKYKNISPNKLIKLDIPFDVDIEDHDNLKLRILRACWNYGGGYFNLSTKTEIFNIVMSSGDVKLHEIKSLNYYELYIKYFTK